MGQKHYKKEFSHSASLIKKKKEKKSYSLFWQVYMRQFFFVCGLLDLMHLPHMIMGSLSTLWDIRKQFVGT